MSQTVINSCKQCKYYSNIYDYKKGILYDIFYCENVNYKPKLVIMSNIDTMSDFIDELKDDHYSENSRFKLLEKAYNLIKNNLIFI